MLAEPFHPHDYVTINGLVSATGKRLNGKIGRIIRPCTAEELGEAQVQAGVQRYVVHLLRQGALHMLKAENLRLTFDTYVVQASKIPGAGLGVFARRDIAAGSTVLVEAPLYKGAVDEAESTLLQDFAKLTVPDRDAVMALSHGPPRPWPSSVEARIWMLNRIPCADNTADYYTLYAVMCRINHSCRYNVGWSHHGGHEWLVAMTAIKKGDELLGCYHDDLLPRHERRLRHVFWGFACHCDRCVSPDEAEERLCARFGELNSELPGMAQRPAPQVEAQVRKAMDLNAKIGMAGVCGDMARKVVLAHELYQLAAYDTACPISTLKRIADEALALARTLQTDERHPRLAIFRACADQPALKRRYMTTGPGSWTELTERLEMNQTIKNQKAFVFW
ncbi:hypothetical protein DIPPA_33481 [Diplonema papillatum]|nr:hypothetical protein DIPPA_33481 [Diplonema papillatum]